MANDIKIVVNGTEMTMEEARDLYQQLKQLFDAPNRPAPIYPFNPLWPNKVGWDTTIGVRGLDHAD